MEPHSMGVVKGWFGRRARPWPAMCIAQRINKETSMPLQIGDIAPDFEAHSTRGPIRFHEWIGDSWCMLFSHPKDFTPVCTTELGYMAGLKEEFARRNAKMIGISVVPVENHHKWKADIEKLSGNRVNRWLSAIAKPVPMCVRTLKWWRSTLLP